jgi:hypothetical protein
MTTDNKPKLVPLTTKDKWIIVGCAVLMVAIPWIGAVIGIIVINKIVKPRIESDPSEKCRKLRRQYMICAYICLSIPILNYGLWLMAIPFMLYGLKEVFIYSSNNAICQTPTMQQPNINQKTTPVATQPTIRLLDTEREHLPKKIRNNYVQIGFRKISVKRFEYDLFKKDMTYARREEICKKYPIDNYSYDQFLTPMSAVDAFKLDGFLKYYKWFIELFVAHEFELDLLNEQYMNKKITDDEYHAKHNKYATLVETQYALGMVLHACFDGARRLDEITAFYYEELRLLEKNNVELTDAHKRYVRLVHDLIKESKDPVIRKESDMYHFEQAQRIEAMKTIAKWFDLIGELPAFITKVAIGSIIADSIMKRNKN